VGEDALPDEVGDFGEDRTLVLLREGGCVRNGHPGIRRSLT
jgi:hypothetical protein